MNPTRRMLAALALAALIAAGCSSSDDTAVVADPDTTTAAPDPTESEPVDEPDPTETTAPAEPVELTASFRGVTEEVIRVGVVGIDFERLTEAGVDLGSSDAAGIYTAALKAINERGGILGRQLELTTERYLPIGGTEADEICARLTEDEEVFIVVGALRLDQVLCYTELSDTAVISLNQQNQERLDRSTAPYVTVRGRNDQRAVEFVAAMVEAGVFEGETVGVLGAIDVDEELYNETVAALRDAGIDPVEGLVGANDGDVNANDNATELVLERFRAEGVTVTVHASAVAHGLGTGFDSGYETTWVQNPAIGAAAMIARGIELSYVDGMLTLMPTPVGTTSQPTMADDPAVLECVAAVEAHGDERVDFTLGAEDGNVNHAINACGIATILELAFTAAGAELTNDSLAAALAGLGEFEMAGFPTATLGPDDFSGASAGELASFSAADEAWAFVD
jgi:ABC-type branched-subunit amino acid transport system substrate-binding protein